MPDREPPSGRVAVPRNKNLEKIHDMDIVWMDGYLRYKRTYLPRYVRTVHYL